MTDTRKQEVNPAIQEEIKIVRKLISEKNMMDEMKEAFEQILKELPQYTNTMEQLQRQFDDFGTQSFEDAFRAVGGEQFSEENKNKELDEILKELASSHADKINPEVQDKLFKVFHVIYNRNLKQ